MERVFLSKRNLLTLLSKLDRVKAGDHSECTIYKFDNQNPKYPQTMAEIAVVATEVIDRHVDGQVALSRDTLSNLVDGLGSSDIGSHVVYFENLIVTAVEDEPYYASRAPEDMGNILPDDDPWVKNKGR